MKFWATRLKYTKTKGKYAETLFNRLRVVLIRSTLGKKAAIDSLLGKAAFGTHFTYFVCHLICTPSLM